MWQWKKGLLKHLIKVRRYQRDSQNRKYNYNEHNVKKNIEMFDY